MELEDCLSVEQIALLETQLDDFDLDCREVAGHGDFVFLGGWHREFKNAAKACSPVSVSRAHRDYMRMVKLAAEKACAELVKFLRLESYGRLEPHS